jgi:hypothetical protein
MNISSENAPEFPYCHPKKLENLAIHLTQREAIYTFRPELERLASELVVPSRQKAAMKVGGVGVLLLVNACPISDPVFSLLAAHCARREIESWLGTEQAPS